MTDPTLPERLDAANGGSALSDPNLFHDQRHVCCQERTAIREQVTTLTAERDNWQRSLEEEQLKGSEEISAIRARVIELEDWQREAAVSAYNAGRLIGTLRARIEQLEKRCGWCDGTGTGRVTVKAGLLDANGGDEPTTISGPCRECDGTGRRAALDASSEPEQGRL